MQHAVVQQSQPALYTSWQGFFVRQRMKCQPLPGMDTGNFSQDTTLSAGNTKFDVNKTSGNEKNNIYYRRLYWPW